MGLVFIVFRIIRLVIPLAIIAGIVYLISRAVQSSPDKKPKEIARGTIAKVIRKSVIDGDLYVTFELKGERHQFSVARELYDQLAEGDVGEIVSKGTVLKSFRPQSDYQA